MSALIPDVTQEELNSKKKNVRISIDNVKKDLWGFLKVKGKELKSLLILKKITCSSNGFLEVVDLMDLMCSGKSLMCLCLMMDIPQERDYTERCRLILGTLFSSIKSANL